MKTKVWTFVGVLLVTLVGTNAWWLNRSLEHAATHQHLADAAGDECEALHQALALMPRLARGASRAAVERAARALAPDFEAFEKEGLLWVDQLGFRFENHRLVEVTRAWEPAFCSPPNEVRPLEACREVQPDLSFSDEWTVLEDGGWWWKLEGKGWNEGARVTVKLGEHIPPEPAPEEIQPVLDQFLDGPRGRVWARLWRDEDGWKNGKLRIQRREGDGLVRLVELDLERVSHQQLQDLVSTIYESPLQVIHEKASCAGFGNSARLVMGPEQAMLLGENLSPRSRRDASAAPLRSGAAPAAAPKY